MVLSMNSWYVTPNANIINTNIIADFQDFHCITLCFEMFMFNLELELSVK
jgi:hypothetical protein